MSKLKEGLQIVVFDFDGTLTRKDTLIDFIRFVFGPWHLIWGFLLTSPWIVLMLLHLYPNNKAKERVFCHFFKGMTYARFNLLGHLFSDRIASYLRPAVVERLKMHLSQGDYVLVITASVPEWVCPLCNRIGIHHVIGTTLQVEDGVLTGHFSTPNCYGIEKVNQLRQQVALENCHIIAYGDSQGDKALFNYADEAYWVSPHAIVKVRK